MSVECWHFLPKDRRLRWGTKEVVRPGVLLKTDEKLNLCKSGFHGSERIIDALQYAPGEILCRVVIGGDIIKGEDKLVGSTREVLWMAEATDMLREFACLMAIRVLHLWEPEPVVVEWLYKQNPAIKDSASASAWASAQGSAWASASALASVWDLDSAWASASAWDSARDSASALAPSSTFDSAFDSANQTLERMAWMLCGPETAQFPEGQI